MGLTFEQIRSEALKLPAGQRAELARRLFESVEELDSGSAADVERSWLEEAERRYQRYLAGETQPVPATDVLARVRARLSDI